MMNQVRQASSESVPLDLRRFSARFLHLLDAQLDPNMFFVEKLTVTVHANMVSKT
jgi:hypothetical protein